MFAMEKMVYKNLLTLTKTVLKQCTTNTLWLTFEGIKKTHSRWMLASNQSWLDESHVFIIIYSKSNRWKHCLCANVNFLHRTFFFFCRCFCRVRKSCAGTVLTVLSVDIHSGMALWNYSVSTRFSAINWVTISFVQLVAKHRCNQQSRNNSAQFVRCFCLHSATVNCSNISSKELQPFATVTNKIHRNLLHRSKNTESHTLHDNLSCIVNRPVKDYVECHNEKHTLFITIIHSCPAHGVSISTVSRLFVALFKNSWRCPSARQS